LDLSTFLTKVSIWAIPLLLAITLHEVAHGWTARFFGDRTAELLGRLSLNPLRHIDPVGTLLVPAVLLAIGLPVIGWAKPVPVATKALRNPRRAMLLVSLAGPLANLAMAALWCVALGLVVRVHGNLTLVGWIASMAQAGIIANTILGLFNLIPIPPLDGGRVVAGLLPPSMATRFERVEPVGFLIVVGLAALGMFGWLLEPASRIVGHVISVLLGTAA
jgi:Zn-dependent protease